MKKILVAYDGTPGAQLAVKDMLRGGFPERAEANVFTVADVWLPPNPPEDQSKDPNFAAVYEKAAAILSEAQNTAIHGTRLLHELFPKWIISNSAQADSPAWGIVAEAKRWNADLIVIGSHGRTPLEKFFLGSVSYKVAAEAICSVRVVRPRHHPHTTPKILIGVDGSPDSQLAIDEVLRRNWSARPEIQLVTVVDAKLKSSLLATKQSHQGAAEVDWIGPKLREYQAKFMARELTAHTQVFEGDPKTLILRHAEKLDVDNIFLGARGLEHGSRLYLGTFASAICTRAHCTVEIVRPSKS